MATAVVPRDVVVPSGTETLGDNSRRLEGLLPSQRETAVPTAVRKFADEAFDALPAHALFGAMRHPALRLLKPIPLRTERSDAGISVIWDDVDEFGFGATFSDAIQDFSQTIAELYLDLASEDLVLGSDLISVRDHLARYMEVREHE